MAKQRFLVGLRRSVAAERHDEYARAWAALQSAAAAHGAHAWRFASAADPALFLEFLEFAADADPRTHHAVAAALSTLDGFGAAVVEEWDQC